MVLATGEVVVLVEMIMVVIAGFRLAQELTGW